jgi:6-phosphogluconate dehydrogenase
LLEAAAPVVADSGEGRWTVDEAVRQGTPTPVIAMALMSRFASQGRADLSNRLLARMRAGFGGHTVKAR